MRIHSHSSLGSFENCPRQYWYQYIGKPPVERVDTIEAFLGTYVHETLEKRSGGLSPSPRPLPEGEGAIVLSPALSQRERGLRSSPPPSPGGRRRAAKDSVHGVRARDATTAAQERRDGGAGRRRPAPRLVPTRPRTRRERARPPDRS